MCCPGDNVLVAQASTWNTWTGIDCPRDNAEALLATCDTFPTPSTLNSLVCCARRTTT